MTPEFERFVSRSNFELAWRRIRNSMRLVVKDRLSLNIFSSTIDTHLDILIEDIKSENLSPQISPYIYVPKKSYTLRALPFLSMRDRLVYQALGNIVIENAFSTLSEFADTHVFSPVLTEVDSDYVFRPALKRGEKEIGQFYKFSQAIENARKNDQYNYFVKADIALFYPSIDHSLLLSTLKKHSWLTDERLLSLMGNSLSIWASQLPDYPLKKGLPIGYETSDILASLFLYEVDQQLSQDCYFLRYVDDMYLFAQNEAHAIGLRSELDRVLQVRGLNLQSSKLAIAPNSAPDSRGSAESIFTLQNTLSSIDQALLLTNSAYQEQAERELFELIAPIVNQEQWENWVTTVDEGYDIEGDDKIIAFVFYRLREKEIWLRNAALYLLEKLPTRSLQLTSYLALFEEDEIVIEKLSGIVNDPNVFAEVRANCLYALVKIWNESNAIRQIARGWYQNNNEWMLQTVALDILQNYPDEYEFLVSQIKKTTEEHLRTALYAACFQLGPDRTEKIYIMNSALDDSSYIAQSLAIHLSLLEPSGVLERSTIYNALAQRLISSVRNTILINPYNTFRQNLEHYLNLEVNPELRLEEIFNDPLRVHRLLLDAKFMLETNRTEFIRNASELLTEIANAVGQVCSKSLLSILPASLLKPIQDLSSGYSRLSNEAGAGTIFGHTKPVVSVGEAKWIWDHLADVTTIALFQIHLTQNLAVPESLLSKATTLHPPIAQDTQQTDQSFNKPLIFFSYAHEDENLRDKIKRHLAYLTNTGQVTLWHDRQIPAGSDWEHRIDKNLKSAQVILFLISEYFMDSKYIQKVEVPEAIRRHNEQQCVAVPIILRDYKWQIDPYKRLQALPKDAKPITQWKHPDSACKDIAEGIENVINLLREGKYGW
jgi:hypothetical protein